MFYFRLFMKQTISLIFFFTLIVTIGAPPVEQAKGGDSEPGVKADEDNSDDVV